MKYILLNKQYCKVDVDGNLLIKGFVQYSDKQLVEEIKNKLPKSEIKNYYIKEIEK